MLARSMIAEMSGKTVNMLLIDVKTGQIYKTRIKQVNEKNEFMVIETGPITIKNGSKWDVHRSTPSVFMTMPVNIADEEGQYVFTISAYTLNDVEQSRTSHVIMQIV